MAMAIIMAVAMVMIMAMGTIPMVTIITWAVIPFLFPSQIQKNCGHSTKSVLANIKPI